MEWKKDLIKKEVIASKEKESQDQGTSTNPLWNSMKDETNYTRTENAALTLKSTQSKVLDLFSMGGALRTRKQDEVEQMISQALAEDFNLGLKCLFYLRDIRGGQGERRTFRTGLDILSKYYPKEAQKIVSLIPEYGRWDDILSLEGVDIKNFLLKQISNDHDSENPSLLAKWLPSENASSKKTKALARALRKYLGLSSKNYRMILSSLRSDLNLVETQMSENLWNTINYSHVPSKANLKYKSAFMKHDEPRYTKFLESVEKGEVKINASTLFPYEIIRDVRKGKSDKALDVLWNNLPDYVRKDDKGIVVADVSGSMGWSNEGLPMNVSISLAMYFAERNVGPFANKFITFSGRPELQDVMGNTLSQKVKNLENAHWQQNTNLQAVFDLILNTAKQNNVSQEDLPKTIYIVSDMEFDSATSSWGEREQTNFEAIKQKYTDAGYEMPVLVFWNVDSRQKNVPVKQDENGVILVSGCSPSIFKMVMEKTTPYKFMLKVLNSDRYKLIEEKINGK